MTEIRLREYMKVTLVDHMGSDESIVRAARASTGNDEIPLDSINGLIGYLIRNRHTSPLEHCVATFRIEAPIFVAREWMRHRTQSYSELSMRFAEASPEFWVPPQERPLANIGNGAHPNLVDAPETTKTVMREEHYAAYDAAWAAYENMLASGIATEVARNVLPVGTFTTWYATANLNNWYRFLTLRDGREGAPQWEISECANLVAFKLGELFPVATRKWYETR